MVWIAAIASASTCVLGLLWRQAARDRDSARAAADSARLDATEAKRVAVETRNALLTARREKDAADRERREAMKKLDGIREDISRARQNPDQMAKLWSDAFK